MMTNVAVTSTATAEVIAAKKSSPSCDQGALVTYNAYHDARRAVLAAYEAEITRAQAAFELAVKTGTRTQLHIARAAFLGAKSTALANRNLALKQLGVAPKFPAGCRLSQS